MFLTNNYKSIFNLMIYSKGNYIYRTTPKWDINKKEEYIGIMSLKSRWSKFLKNKRTNIIVDYTIMPYGNSKHSIQLEIDSNNKIFLYDSWGRKCF